MSDWQSSYIGLAHGIRTNIKEGLKVRVSEVILVPKPVNKKKNHISVCVYMGLGCHTFYSYDQNLMDPEVVTYNWILFNVWGWPVKKTL